MSHHFIRRALYCAFLSVFIPVGVSANDNAVPQDFVGDWGRYACGFEQRWQSTSDVSLQRAVAIKSKQIVWAPDIGMRCDLQEIKASTPDRLEGVFSCGDPKLGGFRATPLVLTLESARRGKRLSIEVAGAYRDNPRFSYSNLEACRSR